MPTHEESPEFMKEYLALSDQDQGQVPGCGRTVPRGSAFQTVPTQPACEGFRRLESVFELTWSQDGRALWAYGPEVHEGEPHIVWLRIGTHDRPE